MPADDIPSFLARKPSKNRWTGKQTFDSDVDIKRAFKFSGAVSPAQITGNQNNYAPSGLTKISRLRLSTDASRSITGLANGADGRVVIIENVGSFNLVLKNQDANSTAGNRFLFGADLTLAADQTAFLHYDGTSARWRCLSVTSTTTTTLASGVYTPTLTNVANVGASTPFQCQHERNGSVVSVSGKFTYTPTVAGVVAQIGISLPVASNIGAAEDCGGVAFSTDVPGAGGGIYGDATNDRAEFKLIVESPVATTMAFSFTYRII